MQGVGQFNQLSTRLKQPELIRGQSTSPVRGAPDRAGHRPDGVRVTPQ